MTRSHGTSPLHLTGLIEPDGSSWRWLGKWLLAIPHFVVLSFLWIGFVLSTVVAGIAILVTRRYPRRIFDFNVGVLRWSWRVSFYAFSALGTSQYPPFSLAEHLDYPATLELEYPERFSRGLVLIKSWLLAIPHYLIVAIPLGAIWSVSTDDGDGLLYASADGLLGLLVLFATAALLFTTRQPQPLYDFVLASNRWAFRVVAYAGLMTDAYPPFRFDIERQRGCGSGEALRRTSQDDVSGKPGSGGFRAKSQPATSATSAAASAR